MSDYVSRWKQLAVAGDDSVLGTNTWYSRAKAYVTVSEASDPVAEANHLVSKIRIGRLHEEISEANKLDFDDGERTFLDAMTRLVEMPIKDSSDLDKRNSAVSAMWEAIDATQSADLDNQAQVICSIQDPEVRKKEIQAVISEFQAWSEPGTSDDLMFWKCFFSQLAPTDQVALEQSLPQSVRTIVQRERDKAASRIRERLVDHMGTLSEQKRSKGTATRKARRRA